VVYSMATPRFPPAPLMPQNRSGSLVGEIVLRTAFLSALQVTWRCHEPGLLLSVSRTGSPST
jgi:hypothetical protein